MAVSSAILLRTLARKSVMGGGIHKGKPIQYLIENNPNYLIINYFKMSMISFTDDVLSELGITSDYRISKPGKNPEMLKEFFTDRLKREIAERANKTDIERIKDAARFKKDRKIYNARKNDYYNSLSIPKKCKGALQAKNHGH